MTFNRRCAVVCATIFLTLAATAAGAQDAVTISGHVSAADHPVQGATVRIQELRLATTTSAEGRYTLIVPSSKVRGQTITLVARHVRYNPEAARLQLVGGSVEKDFQLVPVGEAQPRAAAAATISIEPTTGPVAGEVSAAATVDSSAFEELAGPTDFVSALAGRVAGLDVTSASTLGGSAPVVLRGYHTIVGNTQPLFVLDGIPLENSAFVTQGQPYGTGGFDYGSPVQGINPSDIAEVTVLRGPDAAVRYGGRAANGVVLITTKNGRGLSGIDVSAHQQYTADSPLRLPSYQNSYGQGLGGKFEFFDGAGAGVNDSVAENWGPALQGQPVAQASYTSSGRADVRPFLAVPNNVADFFQTGRTLKTEVAAQGANDQFAFRLAANRRDSRGVVPSSGLTRQGVGLTASDQFTPEFSATVLAQFGNDVATDRAGTGFDTSNPISDLTRIGRQVDVSALKAHVIDDATQQQISWNYAGHNNPYFAQSANSNRDERNRWTLGGTGTYALSKRASATIRAGTDRYDEDRNFDIAPSWMGGFPFYAGRGDFSNGGFQRQTLTGSSTDAELSVAGDVGGTSPSASTGVVTLSGGIGRRSTSVHVASSGSDQAAADSAGAPTPPARIKADNSANSLFASANWAVNPYTSVAATVRNEWYSILSSGHDTQLYPAVTGTFDLARAAGLKGSMNVARLRAGWARSGGEVNGLLLWNVFAGSQSAPISTVSAAPNLGPEITNAFQLGGSFGFFSSRIGVDLTYYNERTSDVIVGLPRGGTGSVVATNAATLTNSGVEGGIVLVPIRTTSADVWTINANFAKNSNTVDAVSGAASVPLGPSLFGLTVEALPGQALGALVGNAYKRDPATHALLLDSGHPIPDTKPRVLGVMAPDWSGGVSTTLRHGIFEVSALVDGRLGGSIYSASNLWGITSGSFAETAFRPDTGLLIAGIDVATGKANAEHVSAEDYYHSLRQIQEAWVYDASFVKLRDLRLTVAFPLRSWPVLTAQSLRASLIGRNLAMWAKAPNIDPETALSATTLQGVEMGQLPTARSIGVQFSLTP
ncbi:MAG TPA: TonB-dependent receptor plug domain-containing protein [Gemmatimonadaceae bacterium]|nr:TonB-dependent receptor plug domain-containing protein [Gemmatimonadaceae bacterium]